MRTSSTAISFLATSLFAGAVVTATIFTAACSSLAGGQNQTAAQSEQDQRMTWWREARFGMFIHWGLYAIPAGEWGDRKGHGEWIRTTARIPKETYAKFQPRWNPTKFDADAWARMAKAAGMKYLVITSKHHDGFCLWDSKETDWDVGNTPHKVDIMAELSAACRRHGVRFCTYHSIMDWHHDDYLPRRGWEAGKRSVAGADFDRFERYLHAQVTELVSAYRPAVMWFDGEWEQTWSHERGKKLFALCRRLAPDMIVNNRVDVHRGGMAGFSKSDEACGDFATPEQEIPATGVPGVDWESCMTMNRHWGWNRADQQWKSTKTLVRNLIDIASKGGNYLLNIGPRGDGTFPPKAVERLAKIGAWMRRNGEAIHGTTANVFDDIAFGRCTVRAGDERSKLYLHVFDAPENKLLTLPGLGSQVVRAYRLEEPSQQLEVTRSGGNVDVALWDGELDPIASVVVVEVEGRPIVYRKPEILADWPEFVTSMTASVKTGPGLVARYSLDGQAPNRLSPVATGPIKIDKTSTLRVRAFHQDRAVSDIATRTFFKVVPAAPVAPDSFAGRKPRPGLELARFAETWDAIDDGVLERKATASTAATINCGTKPGDGVVLRFAGYLRVPEAALYRFALASDDGSKLWIHKRVVVDNDGLHGTVEKRGAIALAKGLHPIKLVWFNKTGGAELKLRWAKPGEPFREVPASAFVH